MKCKICDKGQLHPVSGDFYDYLSGERFELVRCDRCQTMETKGDIKGNYYGQAYYGSEKGKFSPFVEKIFTYNHKRNARNFFTKFRPKTVLEIGCGRGYLIKELQNLGCLVNGLESSSAAEWILKNPEVPVTPVNDAEKWPFEDNSQDLIIIWHVLEHVSDPKAVLKEIHRVLSPKGTLCISVPNARSIQANLKLPQWFHLDTPRHLFHFNPKSLDILSNDAGFLIIKRLAGDFTQNLYGWWQTLLNIISPQNNNLLYRFLQGGYPWKSTKNKYLILIHFLLLIIIIPTGLIGLIIEMLFNRPGNITFYLEKQS